MWTNCARSGRFVTLSSRPSTHGARNRAHPSKLLTTTAEAQSPTTGEPQAPTTRFCDRVHVDEPGARRDVWHVVHAQTTVTRERWSDTRRRGLPNQAPTEACRPRADSQERMWKGSVATMTLVRDLSTAARMRPRWLCRISRRRRRGMISGISTVTV